MGSMARQVDTRGTTKEKFPIDRIHATLSVLPEPRTLLFLLSGRLQLRRRAATNKLAPTRASAGAFFLLRVGDALFVSGIAA